MHTKTLRRGNETKFALMLVHTVLLDVNGRKLPYTRENAMKAFDEDKKAKLVEVTNGESKHYQFETNFGRFELFSQRS